jgi:cytochrome b561
MFKNSIASYGSMSRFLHWFMALCFIILIIVGVYMVGLPPSDTKWQIYTLHKSVGLLMGVFAVIRLYWAIVSIKPAHPATTPAYQELLAKIGHWSLYAFILIMPVSGLTMSLLGGHDINAFWLFSVPALGKFEVASLLHGIHVYGYLVLLAIIVLHVAAALYHHYYLKDNVLRRMIKGS